MCGVRSPPGHRRLVANAPPCGHRGTSLMNCRTAELNSSGASMLQTWPAPGSTMSVERAMAGCGDAARARTSQSPYTSSVGTVTRGRLWRHPRPMPGPWPESRRGGTSAWPHPKRSHDVGGCPLREHRGQERAHELLGGEVGQRERFLEALLAYPWGQGTGPAGIGDASTNVRRGGGVALLKASAARRRRTAPPRAAPPSRAR